MLRMKTIVIVALLMGLYGCFSSNTSSDIKSTPTSQSLEDQTTITKAEADKIKPGMTYQQVIDIVGFEGQWLKDPDNNGDAIVQYNSADGGVMTVEFKTLKVSNVNADNLKQ